MAGTWSSGTSMAYTHGDGSGIGSSTTDGLCFAGYGTGASKTEVLSSTTWSTSGDYNTTVAGQASCGTTSAALGISGYNQARCNKFNGSTWSDASANYTTTTWNFGAAGTQSAGIAFGGAMTSTGSQKFNGTSWSDGGNLSNGASERPQGAGTSSATMLAGGNYTPDANDYKKCQTYNGSSWSAGTSYNTTRLFPSFFGTTSSGLVVGGCTSGNEQTDLLASTELWNGSSWAADGSMTQAIWQIAGVGSTTSGARYGGRVYNDSKQNTVELYAGESLTTTSTTTTTNSTTTSTTTTSTSSSTSTTSTSSSSSTSTTTTSTSSSTTTTSTTTTPGDYVLDQYNTTAKVGGHALQYNSDTQKIATGFKPGITGILNEIQLNLFKGGTPPYNIFVQIFTDNNDDPNIQTGGNSTSVAGSALSSSDAGDTWVSFTWESNAPSLTAGTRYWIVLTSDNPTSYSTVNWVGYQENTTQGTNQSITHFWNTSSWTTANYYALYKTYMPGSETTTSTTTTSTSSSTSTTTTSTSSSTSTTSTSSSTSSSTSTTTIDPSCSVDQTYTGFGTDLSFGDNTNERVGQQFTPSHSGDVCSILLQIKKVGNPTDETKVEIYSLNSGVPNTLLGACIGNDSGTTLSTSYKYVYYPFSGPYLTASTMYGFVISRTGAQDASNYYKVLIDTGGGYLPGDCLIETASWAVDTDKNFWFYEYYNTETTTTSTTTTSTSSSTSTTTTSTSSSTSTTTTSTSTSSSTSTTSTSISTSTTTTSTSTTTTLSPVIGGLAFGEENPVGESAVPWATWDGTGSISGDASWGKLELNGGENQYSRVYDFGDETSRVITVTENKYGTGQGDATVQIRGQATLFSGADVSPSWEDYTTPVAKTWKYIQVRAIK